MLKKQILRPAIGTALILLIPLVMTIIDHAKAPGEGWHWSPGDFIIMGVLVFGAGLFYELLAGKMRGTAARIALGGAVLCVVIAIWIELAVDGVSQLISLLIA